MNNRIKEAFGDVHAEESLTRGTLDAVRRLTHGYRRRVVTRRLAPALACLMIALGGMGGLYFTPTSVISIDVNPSLELSVNRFDRVVGVTSYNEDGRALVQELTLTHQNYAEAVEQVLDSPAAVSYTHLVPPTLVSLAIAPGVSGEVISPEFKAAGHTLCLLRASAFDAAGVRRNLDALYAAIRAGKVLSAWALGLGGVAEAALKMALGNRIGAHIERCV